MQLHIEALGKQYGTRWVLRDIAAELSMGDVLLVTGYNGSGKSTLLRLLAGLQRPTTGNVEYIIANTAYTPVDARLFVGMVGPDVQLYRELSAIEHVRFVSDVRGLGMNTTAQRQILAQIGLGNREDALVGSFSSGMQQRLRYALAIMIEPHVLLLDEPTTNLDTAGIALVDQVVEQQRQRGIIVIATNDQRDWQYGSLRLALDEV